MIIQDRLLWGMHNPAGPGSLLRILSGLSFHFQSHLSNIACVGAAELVIPLSNWLSGSSVLCRKMSASHIQLRNGWSYLPKVADGTLLLEPLLKFGK